MLKGEKRDSLKRLAISLRKRGYTYPMIEKKIGVVRATLGGWFKNLELPEVACERILERKRVNLERHRIKALQALRKRRAKDLENVYIEAGHGLSLVKFDLPTIEVFLAMLYLGEGFKRRSTIGLGNSNADIMSIYIKMLRRVYKVNENQLTCYLHLRFDQDPEKERRYWSQVLNIGEDRFRKSQFDKRTKGSKTWESYHGVCCVYCNCAKIEKRLTALQKLLVEKIKKGG